jgi:glycerol kinase
LRVDGALTQSHTLMQAVADLMQIEIEVSPVGRASLLGTSALARVAVDPAIGLTDALVARVPTRVHAPRWSADQAANFLGRWTLAAQSA